MSSADEREIRDAVTVRLRQLLPNARIVHELNVAGQGTNRIDVAAVTPEAIVGVEIKSRKDVLKRLDEQWTAFRRVCHYVVVAAHEKHFKEYRGDRWRADVPGYLDLNHPLFFGKAGSTRSHVWRFPPPVPGAARFRNNGDDWRFDLRDLQGIPRATDMLGMLWASELQAECHRHGISATSRATRSYMVREMAWHMTGREITHAVCRQLRARSFAEADQPILPVPVQTAATAHPDIITSTQEGTPV